MAQTSARVIADSAQPIPVISIPSERAGLGLRSPLGPVLGALGSPDHQSEGEWFCDRPDGDDAKLMINGRSVMDDTVVGVKADCLCWPAAG